MKFAVLDTVYDGYVNFLYRDATLRGKSWAEQYKATIDGGFPTLSAWVEPLRAKGHEVMDIWGNHMPLQMQWCIENGAADTLLRRVAALQLEDGRSVGLERPAAAPAERPLFVDIVMEQICRFQPDVIVSGYLHYFNTDFLRAVRPYYKLAVGQHAAALPECDFSGYDVIISSLLNQVEWFKQHGVASHHVRLAFDARLADRLIKRDPRYGLIFAGQVSHDHKNRKEALLAIAKKREVDVFAGSVPWDEDTIRRTKMRVHPAQWGMEMYQTMADSKIVFNCHIDAATTYANNLRLYEASGCGALLLTDWKVNMNDILTPGVECVTYKDVDDCVNLAKKYLDDRGARKKIAEAGQKRIMAEHTYFHRVDELLDVVAKHMT